MPRLTIVSAMAQLPETTDGILAARGTRTAKIMCFKGETLPMRHLFPAFIVFVVLALGAPALAQRSSEDGDVSSSGGDDSFLGNLFSTETKTTVTSGQNAPNINEAQMEAYDGPKARIAVAQFTDKTHGGWWNGSIGDGMADQLATALFNSNRYIVLERQLLDQVLQEQDLGASGRIRSDTAAPIGEIEGAELLITGSVTEFEGNASGTQGGLSSVLGGTFGSIVGAISGGYRKAHIAIDVRVIDTRTSRIVAATSIEGEATDVNLGGALGGAISGGALGGSLSGWKNTPIEKALRLCIKRAVEFIASKTPQRYYRIGATPVAAAAPQPAATGQTPPPSPVYAMGDVVRVKSERINMRAGPSTQNAVVVGLTRGAPLLVEDRSGDWIRVKTEGGDSGWVAAWLTYGDPKLTPDHFAPAPAAPAAPAAQPQPVVATVAAPASSRSKLISRLKQLKELYDAELINEEEYSLKKKELLDQL